LFGSYVKTNEAEPSDLDVAVEISENQLAGEDLFTYWHFNKWALTSELQGRVTATVDLQLHAPITPNVCSYVADHGVLVFGK
jgi:predicted nucleotidyltransferase